MAIWLFTQKRVARTFRRLADENEKDLSSAAGEGARANIALNCTPELDLI